MADSPVYSRSKEVEMTSTPAVTESDEASWQNAESQSWGGIAVGFAGDMARVNSEQYHSSLTRGDLANLRRMDLDDPDPIVIRMMTSQDALAEWVTNDAIYHKWTLILQGLALMTPRSSGDGSVSAHDGNTPVGQALYQAGYSESRFNRLLAAREEMLHTLLSRMFRMMAAADQRFSWREMARLIRSSDYNEDRAEQCRRRISSYYYRSQRQATQSDNENN